MTTSHAHSFVVTQSSVTKSQNAIVPEVVLEELVHILEKKVSGIYFTKESPLYSHSWEPHTKYQI
jgi:hypothetical protein